MFDSDKFGKDKSLGKINVNPEDLDSSQPRWLPLKGAKSGEILLNTELLAPGQAPSGMAGDDVLDSLKGEQINREAVVPD